MLIEAATYCDAEISKTNGAYTGESLAIVNKLKSAINYAYKKIALDKVHLEYEEELSDTSNCTKRFYKAISLKTTDVDPIDVPYTIEVNTIKYDYDGAVMLRYAYVPDDLEELTDIPVLPPNVDLRIPCYYAAYFYLANDSDERAGIYLDLWNDGYNSIQMNKKIQKYVRGRWY